MYYVLGNRLEGVNKFWVNKGLPEKFAKEHSLKSMKAKILLAIEMAKKEILSAIKKQPKKRRKTPSYLQSYFERLSALLDDQDQPSKGKMAAVVTPLVEALELEDEIPNGLLDLLSPPARKSVLMLFLIHMLQEIEPKPETNAVPLEVSPGDNIPQEVIDGQVPYNQKPVGKLDPGY